MAKLQADMQKMQEQMAIERDRLALSREEFEAKYEIDAATGVAAIRETNANTRLKEAQTAKAFADAGQTDAQAAKTEIETSDEIREAQDILANGIEGSEAEGTSEGESGAPEGGSSGSQSDGDTAQT